MITDNERNDDGEGAFGVKWSGAGDWERQKGPTNYDAENQGFQKTENTHPATDLRDQRDKGSTVAKNQGYGSDYVTNVTTKAGNSNLNKETGLDSEELYGLNLEERKRQRTEAQINAS
ncbi:hypothetical protein POM88_016837 [Heracleum sosnowskyi]|uniref:Uncharacterized protein n=1 Tax=Heracleum sosnowskyi TaxID=360622 RepID=A0AAD8IMF0_9APIA|nr:hypothetical protein POM88_016837 [Heracleum sosnowskyi]